MRKLPFNVIYRTEKSIMEIEAWMTESCSGEWDVRLAGIIEKAFNSRIKQLEVYFEHSEDKEKFKKAFAKN